jgi:hypothetical protein
MQHNICQIIFLQLVFATILLMACGHDAKNPREMNGHTVLRTADSVYFVTFKIDSVWAMEYEPKEDPR